MNDAQALWDQEDAALYRERVRAASEQVQAADAAVFAARTVWREAVTALAAAEAAITDWSLTLEPIPPAIFLQRLRALEGERQRAEDELRRAKGELNGARAKRGRVWEDRRICIRTKFESFPLEEFAARQQEGKLPDAPAADPDSAHRRRAPEEERLPRIRRIKGMRRIVEVKPDVAFDLIGNAVEDEGYANYGEFGNWHFSGLADEAYLPTYEEISAAASAAAGYKLELHEHAILPGGDIVLEFRRAKSKQPIEQSPQSPPGAAGDPETEDNGPTVWDEPWPGGLTEDALSKSYIADKLASIKHGVKRSKNDAVSFAAANPFEWEGRLWVCIGMTAAAAEVLPLIPLGEFAERYPGYPTKYRPDCPLFGSREERLQFYTGVVVKVGRKQYAIAPAGERRVLLRPKGETS